MGYVSLGPHDAARVLFARARADVDRHVRYRTTLGDLRRAEEHHHQFQQCRRLGPIAHPSPWAKTLASLRKPGPMCARCAVGDAGFVASIERWTEIKQYETGISPIFEQLEGAQLDGAGGGAYADRLKVHMEATDKLFSSLADSAPCADGRGPRGVDRLHLCHVGADRRGPWLLALAVLIPLTFFSVRSITKSLGRGKSWPNALQRRPARDAGRR